MLFVPKTIKFNWCYINLIEPFYIVIDHKRLNQLTKIKLFQLKVLNFSLLLIDERGRNKQKFKYWQKSKYPTSMLGISSEEKLISNKISSDCSFRDMSTN